MWDNRTKEDRATQLMDTELNHWIVRVIYEHMWVLLCSTIRIKFNVQCSYFTQKYAALCLFFMLAFAADWEVEGCQLPQHIEKRTITHLCRGIPALPQIYIFHIYTRPKFTQNPNPVEGTLSNMESKAKSGLSRTTCTMKLY